MCFNGKKKRLASNLFNIWLLPLVGYFQEGLCEFSLFPPKYRTNHRSFHRHRVQKTKLSLAHSASIIRTSALKSFTSYISKQLLTDNEKLSFLKQRYTSIYLKKLTTLKKGLQDVSPQLFSNDRTSESIMEKKEIKEDNKTHKYRFCKSSTFSCIWRRFLKKSTLFLGNWRLKIIFKTWRKSCCRNKGR